jgi:hypothetical protein
MHKQIRTLTIEAVFADTFQKICLNNKVDEHSLDKLIARWVDNNVVASMRAVARANLKKRLAGTEFSHKTFITGIQVLGIEKFSLDLHLEYTNKNPEPIAKDTRLEATGTYNLADI